MKTKTEWRFCTTHTYQAKEKGSSSIMIWLPHRIIKEEFPNDEYNASCPSHAECIDRVCR